MTKNKESVAGKLLDKLISQAQAIDKFQTEKLRKIVSSILQQSATRKTGQKQWDTLSGIVSLGVLSAIKKSKGTYKEREFGGSVKNLLISQYRREERSKYRLYLALRRIQKEGVTRLNQALEINMIKGPTKCINFLIGFKGILLVQAAMVEDTK